MAKIKIDDGTVRAHDIQLDRIEIVTDSSNSGKIEIYMLDEQGHRVEGGSFDASAFMNLVKLFYDENF
jgi:hypothetical protein